MISYQIIAAYILGYKNCPTLERILGQTKDQLTAHLQRFGLFGPCALRQVDQISLLRGMYETAGGREDREQHRISRWNTPNDNARELANFMGIPLEEANLSARFEPERARAVLLSSECACIDKENLKRVTIISRERFLKLVPLEYTNSWLPRSVAGNTTLDIMLWYKSER